MPVLNTHSAAINSSRFPTLIVKDFLQYAAAALIFVLYGVQVCPFLETLERPLFVVLSLGLFSFLFLARSILVFYFCHSHRPLRYQFYIDMMTFVGGGVLFGLGTFLLYGFPLESGFRVLIGVGLLGSLISFQLMLNKESRFIETLTSLNTPKYTPISSRVRYLALLLVGGAILTMLLVVYKDMQWLQNIGNGVSLNQASLWILYEFLFVAAIFMGYGALIIRQFSKNIQAYFAYQNSVLAELQQGQRHISVPLIGNDEFSRMGLYTNHMIESLSATEDDLVQTRDAAILAISSLAETRDNETGAHILRTQEYVRVLGEYLQSLPKYHDTLTDDELTLIYKSAPLHDIGKVGIPDSILLKPGKLTDSEFDIMKAHPLIGRQALEKAEEQTGPLPFLFYAKEISESHHEKWDGSGYPYGLVGDAIPLSGRLMALADVYDALPTQRVYKPAFSHEKAKSIILDGRGSHFDPELVDAFLELEDVFIDIAQSYKDECSEAKSTDSTS